VKFDYCESRTGQIAVERSKGLTASAALIENASPHKPGK
jgi:hypothetical protein